MDHPASTNSNYVINNITCIVIRRVNRHVLLMRKTVSQRLQSVGSVRLKDSRHELRRATRSTLQRVHKCIEVGGGIFENLL